MDQREYEITIAADGTVELNVHGHKGKSCFDVAKIFADIVGEQKSHELKSEFYEPDQEVHHQVRH